jgi:hypothetical protein
MKQGSILAFLLGIYLGFTFIGFGMPFWLAAILGGALAGTAGALADIYIFKGE